MKPDVSADGFHSPMPSPRFEALVRRRTEQLNRQLAGEIVRLREDAGLSQREVAAAAGFDRGYLSRIENSLVQPRAGTYARIAAVLGADFNAHLYPSTGPAIHDRHQAPILEALLTSLHARWESFPEVAVRHPSRGWIDLALHDRAAPLIVATEIESDLRRLERLVRWSIEKAASLPSWDGWQRLPETPAVSRLVVARRTRANLAIVHEFGRQIALTWPAHPEDAIASLTGPAPWPGAALIWAVHDGRRFRLVPTRG